MKIIVTILAGNIDGYQCGENSFWKANRFQSAINVKSGTGGPRFTVASESELLHLQM